MIGRSTTPCRCCDKEQMTMDDLIHRMSTRLAARASRGGFLRFAGGAALGFGLALHGVSLGEANAAAPPPCACGLSCSGCDGGACSSTAPGCMSTYGLTCVNQGCPSGCCTSGSWSCCTLCCWWKCNECGCTINGQCQPCRCFVNSHANCGGCNCPNTHEEAAA